MHREVRDKLEEILAGTGDVLCERHLKKCEDCNAEVAAMSDQRSLLRTLRPDERSLEPGRSLELEPAPGFYARVMERIETQGVVSIWNLFFDSRAGRRLAMASMAVALSLGVYLVSSERAPEPDVIQFDGNQMSSDQVVMQDSGGMLSGSPDADAVLVNLVTYREQ